MTAPTGTVTLHRVLRAPPERVYRAFLDPDAMAKWLPPHGFTGRVLEQDLRVGGRYRMQFTNLGNGQVHAFGGEYLELVPGERIVNTDRFDTPDLPGEMRTTVTLQAVAMGHRAARGAGGHSRRHPPHRVLPGLAGFAATAGAAGGARDSGHVMALLFQ